jgi:hypothetical protein
MNIRRRCEATVQELISRTDAIVLFGYPEATILAISCSRGLSSDRGLGLSLRRARSRTPPTSTSRRTCSSPAKPALDPPCLPEKAKSSSARLLKSVSMSLGMVSGTAGLTVACLSTVTFNTSALPPGATVATSRSCTGGGLISSPSQTFSFAQLLLSKITLWVRGSRMAADYVNGSSSKPPADKRVTRLSDA